MPIIPKETIEQIRDRTDIVEVIGEHIRLQRAGATFRALCPFHKEKTPSFHVNPQRQIFHCFGCGKGGDVFRFLMDYAGLPFVTAVSSLAQRAGIALRTVTGEGGPGVEERDTLFRIHTLAAEFYHRQLLETPAGETARQYLAGRELDQDTLAAFQVGYAPNQWDALRNEARRAGFDDALVEKSGLVVRRESEKGSHTVYDRFRHRVMIPIRDAMGHVIAFTGRALAEDAKGAKYVNSPETPLFHKSRVLFGLDRARRALLDTRRAILCEGQIDAIRCQQAGFAHAVAVQGTALTEAHARILQRYADSVTLVLDADRAGEDAALRGGQVLLAADLAVDVAALPAGTDPDSLIRERGAKAFQEVLDSARDLIDFQIDVLGRRENMSTPEGLLRGSRAVAGTLRVLSSAVLLDRYVRQAAERLGVSEQALRHDLARSRGPRQTATEPEQEQEQQTPSTERPPETEVELLIHLCQHPEDQPLIQRYLPLDTLTHPQVRTLTAAMLEHSGEPGWSLTRAVQEQGGALLQLAARCEITPSRIAGAEVSSAEAARFLLLKLRREDLERRRARLQRRAREGNDPKATLESRELTRDITLLRMGWEHALPLLELEHHSS